MAFWDGWAGKFFGRSVARDYVARLDNPQTSWVDWLSGTQDAYEVAYGNPVAARCADMIGQAVAQLPIEVWRDGKRVEDHPLVDVLNRRANGEDSAGQVKYALAVLMATYGQAYLRGVRVTAGLSELYVHGRKGFEPRRDRQGVLNGYEFRRETGGPVVFPIEPDGWCEVRRIIRQRPNLRDRAASPVEMAGRSIEENNAVRGYAKGQFEHQGRRPAVVVVDKDTTLEPDQIREERVRLSQQMKDDATRRLPTFLAGTLSYQELGASSSDMQAMELRNATAREICFGLGVPPVLLGIAGDSTFNNQAEARVGFARDTVRPLCEFIAGELTAWLQPVAPGVEIRFDYSADAASAADEAVRWERAARGVGLSINEKRQLVGFGPVGGEGDVVLVAGGEVPLGMKVGGAQ
ncbi:hypothetical protein ABAC460_23020 [Asticcacaulis sp. AC460]|uniref:phage portal protein n=1 Tax=Asticcacaulis sp. AC460 TaxID=1282360 RepID=UPI0003C3CF50|nr:phage portal protein [Asticcacaulis sp. AC460]ESQ86588.1 hypothetical protein ABAC460_23020 [Asticcacaulis sp. AC460]